MSRRYNKAKVKAWIEKSIRGTIIVRLDQNLVSDGYVVLKIDKDIQDILDEKLITESVMVRDGLRQSSVMDLQKVVDAAKGDFKYQATPLTYASGKVQATIFLPEGKGETHFINSRFVALLDPNLKPVYTGGEKATTALTAKDGDYFVALMLPTRVTEFKFKIEKG